MVVCVLKAALQGIVIHIGNAELGFYPGDTHGFKFQICHCAGGVLCQGLVYAQGYFAARRHVSGYQMCGNYLLCYSLTHCS